MNESQQQRINEAVAAWAEKIGGFGRVAMTETSSHLYDAWQAAQPPKPRWVVDASWAAGVMVKQQQPTTRAYLLATEAEARAVCAALNALAESEART